MIPVSLNTVLLRLRRLSLAVDDGPTDGQLLDRFLTRGEEEAFAILVGRHGPLVWSVCRRMLGNVHDAEDAFQACFLVLLRKGAALRTRLTVGDWLYGVAYHTALKALDNIARRRRKERQVPPPQPAEAVPSEEWRPLLDQELHRLPDRYRSAIVLCDLQGEGRREAARLLGIPEGTLSSRLAMGRRLLAKRLERRGLSPSVLSGLFLTADVPGPLAQRLVEAVLVSGSATAGVTAEVAALTRGVLQAMFLKKFKVVLAFVLGFVLLTVGVGSLVIPARADAPALSVAAGAPLPAAPFTAAPLTAPQQDQAEKKPEPQAKAEGDVHTIDLIDGIEPYTLKGKYKKVVIVSITGAGIVDADPDNFEAEEIEIRSVDGARQVKLQLSSKKPLKKLTLGKLGGATSIDLSALPAESIEIEKIGGAGHLQFQSMGGVVIKEQIGGAANVKITAVGDVRVGKGIGDASNVTIRTKGDILVEGSLSGAASLTVPLCKNFTVKGGADGVSSADVMYFGKAECAGTDLNMIKLTKVEPPK
jgi:RNA polymerase sigma factor (sigma-70 family)